MPISTHLLERGYQLIDAGQFQNAEMVLDAVVRVDPKNVMAWKAYLQIYQDREDLEWLMERILKNKDLSDKEKEDIRAYHNYLIQAPGKNRQHGSDANPEKMYAIELEQEIHAQDDKIIFELIDEFDYPVRKIEQSKKRRSRQMFKYNIPLYIWQAAALLLLFYAGIRMLVLGYLFGYLMVAAFIIGGVFWIRNFNSLKEITSAKITHAYSLESENDLFIIDKPVINPKIGEKNKDSASRIRYLDK